MFIFIFVWNRRVSDLEEIQGQWSYKNDQVLLTIKGNKAYWNMPSSSVEADVLRIETQGDTTKVVLVDLYNPEDHKHNPFNVYVRVLGQDMELAFMAPEARATQPTKDLVWRFRRTGK
jgi:hypothetical protein